MFIIQQVTSDPLQKRNLILQDGTSLTMTMYFVPLQFGWFITNLTYGAFQINGLRITNSPNMLHQFKNEIPFGLSCFSKENREPSQQQDFSSGASTLYLLSKEEVKQYSELLSGKV